VDVEVHRGQPVARLARLFAVLEKGDDPALLRAHPHRITSGDAEADLAGDEALPVFEPARVVADDVGVGSGPGGGLEIDKRRIERPDRVAPHVEEARAVRPPADACGPGPRDQEGS